MHRRFSRQRFRTNWWLLAIAMLLVFRIVIYLGTPQPVAAIAEGVYLVDRVVDGDTLLLDLGERVRLQGIDCPETVHPDRAVEPWGPDATAFTDRFVAEAGGEVRLTFSSERLDQYGRHLAFVWHGERLLNEELVRSGLARARLDYRYSGIMKRRLAAAQDDARKAGRGLWSLANPAAADAE